MASQVALAGLSGSSHTDMIMLTVDKSTLKAELKTWPDDPTKATTTSSGYLAFLLWL